MKKLLSVALLTGIFSFSYAEKVDLLKGWNNIGLSEEYNVSSFDNSNIDIIWHYNNTTKKWEVYSKKYKIPNYEIIKKNIPAGEAIWIFSEINQDIDISDSNQIISSYNSYNQNYEIVKKEGNYYFDYYDNNISKEFPLEINGSIEDGVIKPLNNGDVLFSLISRTGNKYGETNSTGYMGYIVNNKFKLKKIGTSQYLYNWGEFNKLPNGEYLSVFTNGCCEKKTFFAYYDPNRNKFSTQEIDNSSLINMNYTNDYLNKVILYNGLENKTIIYNFNKDSINKITLNGNWKSYQSIDNKVIFISRYNYSNGDKVALFDDNGDLVSKHTFNKIVRAVGVDYSNNTIFAFTQNDINETLDIYSSNDYGKTWDKNLSINNFNYMINYVNDVHQTDNGLSLSMRVNNYSFTIQTEDSFKTIKKINYRKRFNRNLKNNKIEYYGNEKIIRFN